jgi:2-hydroxy-3-oxopropionate reductase
MRFGYVGLGSMGRPASSAPLVDAGATACASPAAVAERSDVVFTMVTATSDVEQVVLGEDALAQEARELASLAPCRTRRVARVGGRR